jgi:predicted RNA-binding Zn ribbon-like protein
MTAAIQNRPFELVAGHPVLDFVNTLDWRFRQSGVEELLNSYGDLVRFSEQSGLITARVARELKQATSESAGSRVLAASKELREAAAEVFYDTLDGTRPAKASIKALESLFKEARGKQSLRYDESRLTWGWPANERDAELPLWLLSLSASRLMTSDGLGVCGEMPRVRACERLECRWLFLDTSKNHTRRWCDMKVCGNRMKARRFRAQRKTGLVNGSSRHESATS